MYILLKTFIPLFYNYQGFCFLLHFLVVSYITVAFLLIFVYKNCKSFLRYLNNNKEMQFNKL